MWVNMGARVTRIIRNFNLENRAHREIAREKQRPAPRHPNSTPRFSVAAGDEQDPSCNVYQKNDTLLAHLKSVYVESTNTAEIPREHSQVGEADHRPQQFSLPSDCVALQKDLNAVLGVTEVPRGKLTITEALKALSSHQQQPQTWTPEKVAQEYSLDLKEAKAALEFFVPFQVKIISAKTDKLKHLK
ncbi:NADH dehydrogenase [ubiquinone] 1 alpha subcomplex assembly factor 4 [Synchiropus splendidus]|uniref:NADH dehydrogenase [ubiquinone] 1 alpha subcomplex assembly factor 4 n=1 Tax=Synchiropus splendidus TaxID=270530 RepID=UPI00237E3D52|nr:NADH dehydrogenase [ubiquinone] 1 alpha subcomplex assembly factor 4 [Synchiropus splendidus]